MKPNARWIRGALVALVVFLLGGRWLSVTLADLMWASSLDISDSFLNQLRLRYSLLAWAFSTAALWCVGNLYLVFRTIGSVHVPRRLANIEILEAVPRRYIGYTLVALGLILAIAMSHDSASWWSVRALATQAGTLGMPDPILGNDIGYYLFTLPWNRTLHGFAVLLSIVVLGVVTILYVAVGAVDVNARRIEISESARRHIGGLLVAVALVLFWGYRLEPAEYVAGLHAVPYDTVLTDVRIPTSRLLGALAILAGIGSAFWMVFGRLSIVAFGWVALATFSITGHYLAPAVALGARNLDERTLSLTVPGRSFVREAFGLTGRDTIIGASGSAMRRDASNLIDRAPVWDPFALNVLLNQVVRDDPIMRVLDVSIAQYPTNDSTPVPVAIGVRDVDLVAIRQRDSVVSWEQRHAGTYASVAEVWVVRADEVSASGGPLFVPDIKTPDLAVEQPFPLTLSAGVVRFSAAASDFAVVGPDDVATKTGVRVGGIFRRLALAWKLQTPRFLRFSRVDSDASVVWDRSVVRRLERFAPFLMFGQAYPVLVDSRVVWLSPGYVAADGFPFSVPARVEGRDVRYYRAGFVGVVDGHTGDTDVYSLSALDPLSDAWARLVPEIIQTSDHIPEALLPHIRYPRELFDAQLRVLSSLSASDWASSTRVPLRPSIAPANQSTFWWAGDSPADTTNRLRIRAALERGDPPALAAVVDGVAQGARLRLDVFNLRPPLQVPGPSQVAARVATELSSQAVVPGNVKTIPTDRGIVSIQAIYSAGTGDGAQPRLLDVFAGFDGGAPGMGRGADLPSALQQVEEIPRAINDVATEWLAARRWFERLDESRRTGQWDTFGEAYEALLVLFGLTPDSTN